MSVNQPGPAPTFYDVQGVAQMFKMSRMTVYRAIQSGELPAVRVGKNYRIRESDVERFLADRSVRAEGP